MRFSLYSIGYSVLEMALSCEVPAGSMIKSACYRLLRRRTRGICPQQVKRHSVSPIVSDLGDRSGEGGWPITKHTYFVIRKNHHIVAGDCTRRAAMQYFCIFHSRLDPAVAAFARSVGFALLSVLFCLSRHLSVETCRRCNATANTPYSNVAKNQHSLSTRRVR